MIKAEARGEIPEFTDTDEVSFVLFAHNRAVEAAWQDKFVRIGLKVGDIAISPTVVAPPEPTIFRLGDHEFKADEVDAIRADLWATAEQELPPEVHVEWISADDYRQNLDKPALVQPLQQPGMASAELYY